MLCKMIFPSHIHSTRNTCKSYTILLKKRQGDFTKKALHSKKSQLPHTATDLIKKSIIQHFQVQLTHDSHVFLASSCRFHPLGNDVIFLLYQIHSKQVHIDFLTYP